MPMLPGGRSLFFVPLLFLAACGDSRTASQTEPVVPAASIDESSAATVTGSVSFTGTAPVMPAIDMSANPSCERQHHTPAHSEQVLVNPNQTLRNTFVWVKDGVKSSRWAPPAEAARLDQNGCIYRPHVLAFMVGQPLEITNSDPVNHNVHANGEVNEGWNEMEPPRAEKKYKQFAKQEILMPVTCSVHPWMRAYFAVVGHPFFAVTGEDGSFRLHGMPPGDYTVEAVHEKYGKKEMHVTLGAKESREVNFEFTSGS